MENNLFSADELAKLKDILASYKPEPQKTEREVALEKQVKDLEDELKTTKTALTAFKDAKIAEVVGNIKAVEKEFDSKILLEGVESPDEKIRILNTYRVALSKAVPGTQNLPLQGGSDDKAIEDKVNDILQDTFGIKDGKALLAQLTAKPLEG